MSLDVLLARQAGVVSRSQALRAGLSGAAVDRLVRTRRWRPLFPCIYRVPGQGPDDEARVHAALLWVGGAAVLSGTTAAWWHGLLARAPGRVAVTVPACRAARRGVSVRCRTLAAADRTEHRGVPVTALGLTVLDSALELGAPRGEQLLDRAVAGGVGWAAVLAAHRRHPAPEASALLEAAAARSAAAANAALVGLLRGSGLRGWHRLPVRAGRPVTVVFPAARVIVEVVGWVGAETAIAVRADPDSCGRAGACTVRFGWPELAGRPREVLAAITTAVDGRDLHHLNGRIGPLTAGLRRGCPHAANGVNAAPGYREV